MKEKLYPSLILAFALVFSCKSEMIKTGENTLLFEADGNGWEEFGDADWKHEEGTLKAQIGEGTGFLMSNEKYSNFDLSLEFNPDSTINSGVFIRCQTKEISPSSCYEMNIWDLHPNQDFSTGSIVTKVAPLEKVITINKWNKYRIKADNDHLKVWVNDKLTAELVDTAFSTGYIAIQAAGKGAIQFRNTKINLQ